MIKCPLSDIFLRGLCVVSALLSLSCCSNVSDDTDAEFSDEVSSVCQLEKVTATTAAFSGQLKAPQELLESSAVVIYYSDAAEFDYRKAESISLANFLNGKSFTLTATGLKYGTRYRYVVCTFGESSVEWGEVQEFTTKGIEISLGTPSSLKSTYAVIPGTVTGLSSEDMSQIGLGLEFSSVREDLENGNGRAIYAADVEDGVLNVSVEGLNHGRTYWYRPFVQQSGTMKYGAVMEFTTTDAYSTVLKDLDMSQAVDLSASATANCYVVAGGGLYKFKAVKGNTATIVAGSDDGSADPVGEISSCTVLWESFGTDQSPECCDLISGLEYENGYIAFTATEKKGNALIAATDAEGKILWSWHIWLTDQPESHDYGAAGFMMDRNLGALSAKAGQVTALGLLYQWGRKDPFLSSSDIHSDVMAKSTIEWPEAVRSTANTGTVRYASENPTTFIGYSLDTKDWQFVQDNTRWQRKKTKYDPCPGGWRVPDGGADAFWAKAGFVDVGYNGTNEGIRVSINSVSAWYPASGFRYFDDGSVGYIGMDGYYWSADPSRTDAYYLYFNSAGNVRPSFSNYRSFGFAVRCQKE